MWEEGEEEEAVIAKAAVAMESARAAAGAVARAAEQVELLAGVEMTARSC